MTKVRLGQTFGRLQRHNIRWSRNEVSPPCKSQWIHLYILHKLGVLPPPPGVFIGHANDWCVWVSVFECLCVHSSFDLTIRVNLSTFNEFPIYNQFLAHGCRALNEIIYNIFENWFIREFDEQSNRVFHTIPTQQKTETVKKINGVGGEVEARNVWKDFVGIKFPQSSANWGIDIEESYTI